MSGVRLSRHYLSRMVTNNWGRIIFISSESAVNVPVEMIHYGVTKTMQLARGLAETTVGTAVTVNLVLAGPTKPEGVEKFVRGSALSREWSHSRSSRYYSVEYGLSRTRCVQATHSLKLRFHEELATHLSPLAWSHISLTGDYTWRTDGGVKPGQLRPKRDLPASLLNP